MSQPTLPRRTTGIAVLYPSLYGKEETGNKRIILSKPKGAPKDNLSYYRAATFYYLQVQQGTSNARVHDSRHASFRIHILTVSPARWMGKVEPLPGGSLGGIPSDQSSCPLDNADAARGVGNGVTRRRENTAAACSEFVVPPASPSLGPAVPTQSLSFLNYCSSPLFFPSSQRLTRGGYGFSFHGWRYPRAGWGRRRLPRRQRRRPWS